MSILIKFICLSFVLSVIAVAHRITYAKFLSTVVFFSTCFLYMFYVFNAFFIGIYLLVTIFFVVLTESIIRLFKEKRWKFTFISGIASPQWGILVVALLITDYFTKSNIVKMIDELHLWGALPRALYYTGNFQSGANSLLLGYKDYIPGMPVTLCFFEWLNGTFKDSVLYFGYCCYGSIAMLIATDHIKWKQWYFIPVLGIAIAFSPLMFYNTVFNDSAIWFKSIHVDPILGILIGCALYLIYDRFWEKRFETLQFILLLCVIVLMKSSGIAMALGLAAGAVVIKHRLDGKESRKLLILDVLVVGCPILIYISWHIAKVVYDIEASVNFSLSNIQKFEYAKEIFRIFFTERVVVFNNVNTGYPATLLVATIFLVILGGGGYILQRGNADKKIMLGIFVIWVFLTVIFLLGMFVLYSESMSNGYAGAPSYPRYISSMLTALWIGIFLIVIKSFHMQTFLKLNIVQKGYILASIMLFILLFPHSPIIGITYPNIVYPEADRYADELRNQVRNGGVLLVVDNEYNTVSPDFSLYLQRRMYYDLLDSDVRLCGIHFLKDRILMDNRQIVVPEHERLMDVDIAYIGFVCVEENGNSLSLMKVESKKEEANVFVIK